MTESETILNDFLRNIVIKNEHSFETSPTLRTEVLDTLLKAEKARIDGIVVGGFKFTPQQYNKVMDLTQGDSFIPVIKELRTYFNLGLKEAKDLFDENFKKFCPSLTPGWKNS